MKASSIIRHAMMAILLMVTCATAQAHRSTGLRPTSEQRMPREELAEVQAKHIAQELAFDEATTKKFCETFCRCQAEIWALGPRPQGKQQGLTEQENEERIKQRFAMSEKILNIRRKYYKEYSAFLTQAQIERVYEIERRMMRRLGQRGTQEGTMHIEHKRYRR